MSTRAEVETLATELHGLARQISWGTYPAGWEGPAHDRLLAAETHLRAYAATLAPQAAPVAEGKPTPEMCATAQEIAYSSRGDLLNWHLEGRLAEKIATALAAEAHKAALEAEARVAEMREALKPFTEIALLRDERPGDIDIIDAPDLMITPNQVRAARRVLTALSSDRFTRLLLAARAACAPIRKHLGDADAIKGWKMLREALAAFPQPEEQQ